MNSLFDKVPAGLFAPLSRKSRSIYAYALVSLYHILRTQKNDIKRSDFYAFLKNNGDDLLHFFSIESDMLDDKSDEEKVDAGKDSKESVNPDEFGLGRKINYIIKKLAKCGWYRLARDPKVNTEYMFIPDYSIELLKVMNNLTSSEKSYLPLVHQTYAELKMEDEAEDDYMYRALVNARNNADRLELNVILLKQQIYVFGNRLSEVFDPNVALSQHFDEYRDDVSEPYYHPMKTFDSLGLFAQPTINILNKWIRSPRIISRIVRSAKNEPVNKNMDIATLTSNIIKMIQEVIDIFSSLSESFNEIDRANSDYTEAVQRKVNYLSSSDKTIKGKIDSILLALRNELANNPGANYEDLRILSAAKRTVNISRHGFVDSASLNMPFKRRVEEYAEPLYFDEGILDADRDEALALFSEKDVEKFSRESITNYFDNTSNETESFETIDFKFNSLDELVLYIYGVNSALSGTIPYKAKKLSPCVEHDEWFMPNYLFEKVKRKGDK